MSLLAAQSRWQGRLWWLVKDFDKIFVHVSDPKNPDKQKASEGHRLRIRARGSSGSDLHQTKAHIGRIEVDRVPGKPEGVKVSNQSIIRFHSVRNADFTISDILLDALQIDKTCSLQVHAQKTTIQASLRFLGGRKSAAY